MEAKFSGAVKDVISLSRLEAIRIGNNFISPEHLVLGIIQQGENSAIKVLTGLNVPIQLIVKDLETSLPREMNPQDLHGSIPLTKQTEKALKITYLEEKLINSEIKLPIRQIDTLHLLLAILRDEDAATTKILKGFNITYDVLKDKALEFYRNNSQEEEISTIKNEPKEEVSPSENIITDSSSKEENASQLTSNEEENILEQSSVHLEFEIPDYLSDEEAIKLIKEGILLANSTYRGLGGSGLKVNDIRVTEPHFELIEN
ncbi:hypothetical protein AAE02nite_42710 [Adhaeribacter aerolatus]|uniref:Clp R domain-containing protein n=1 Tax=Adhaeribacter aerolatus TaxID=670289 RepID=A0A512B494_9BACT|nr:Clp protease N-terminal domain-containing protein [Adhaeribacter aerolatus]GEO06607.1 hypothetical protein AAE02nite_42710 [Adhaeribacter aerolatus]